jgi:hypothetical protein
MKPTDPRQLQGLMNGEVSVSSLQHSRQRGPPPLLVASDAPDALRSMPACCLLLRAREGPLLSVLLDL